MDNRICLILPSNSSAYIAYIARILRMIYQQNKKRRKKMIIRQYFAPKESTMK